MVVNASCLECLEAGTDPSSGGLHGGTGGVGESYPQPACCEGTTRIRFSAPQHPYIYLYVGAARRSGGDRCQRGH